MDTGLGQSSAEGGKLVGKIEGMVWWFVWDIWAVSSERLNTHRLQRQTVEISGASLNTANRMSASSVWLGD